MLWAVIMAGGFGTRFWPESRQAKPKQFLRFFSRETLLEQALSRLSPQIPPSRVFAVTQQDKVSLTRKLLKKVPAKQIIGEPVGRNTAPCAVLAARLAIQRDPHAVIALFPADHVIVKTNTFRQALKSASEVAEKSLLPVTFGIRPSFPHTGYGYLEMGRLDCKSGGFPVYKLKKFHEKPNDANARRFVRSGKFLWNSGMFVWKASALLAAAETHLPLAKKYADKIVEASVEKGLKKYFPFMPNISIDYGLMEKLKGQILTIPVDFGWNDVGSWHSLSDLAASDHEGNIVTGQVLMVDSRRNIVRSGKRLIALLGMEDCVVVDTEDALLVCPRSKTESIRKVVDALRKKKLTQYL